MNLLFPRIGRFALFAVLACTCVAQAQDMTGSTSIAIVIDDSQAARKQLPQLREGVLAFVKEFGDDDELCLIGAGGQPHILHELTYDPALITETVRKVRAQKGDSSVLPALATASQHLQSESANDKAAVVLFIGSEQESIAAAENAIAKNEEKAPVHVIAAPGTDWRTQEQLQRLTASTGGVAYFPSSTKQLREVSQEAGRRLAGRPTLTTATEPKKRKGSKEATKALAGYEQLTVRSIPVEDNPKTEQFMGGDNVILQRVLVERLQRAKVFPSIVDGSATRDGMQETSADTSPGKKLELRATLIEYERGSRMKRQFTFGGAAKLSLKVDMVDAASGQTVDSFVKQGSAYMGGLFGGSQESVLAKAMLDVANNVLKELQRRR